MNSLICRGDLRFISSLHSCVSGIGLDKIPHTLHHVPSKSFHPPNGQAAIMMGFATHSSLIIKCKVNSLRGNVSPYFIAVHYLHCIVMLMQCCSSTAVEAIEMTTLTNMSGRWPHASSMTPPVLCSSRASESSGSGRRVTLTPADSMEYIRKMIKEDRSSSLLDKSGYTLY